MKKKYIVLLILLVIMFASIGGIYYYGVSQYKNQFYPNSYVNGIDVSGKTPEEVKSILEEELGTYSLTINAKYSTDILTAEDIELAYLYNPDGKDVLEDLLKNQDAYRWPFIISGNLSNFDITIYSDYNHDKIQDLVAGLNCCNPAEVVESRDAYIDFQDGHYLIVPDSEGNIIDKTKVESLVRVALNERDESIDISNTYIQAQVRADNELLNKRVNSANAYLNSDITITTARTKTHLTPEIIKDFLVFNDDGTVDIDRDLVYEWVNDNISGPNYTIGKERTVATPSSGTVTLKGGTYGMWVNVPEETDQIISEIKNGETVERQPICRVSEISTENAGIGNTFIDVNISNQKVYLVKDGVIDYETSCVTGNTSSGHGTPTGIYYVSWKTTNWHMKKYNVTVNYWMPIDDSTGVGLHDATWRGNFGGSIYKTNGSHGCINLPLSAAKYIYNNSSRGIPVLVHY